MRVNEFSAGPLKLKAKKASQKLWLHPRSGRYGLGQNPWKDIFDQDILEQIGKILDLHGEDRLLELKIFLSISVDGFRDTIDFVGGHQPPGKKSKWRASAIKQMKRLKLTLEKDESLYSSHVSFYPKGFTLHFSKGLRTEIQKTRIQMEQLLRRFEELEGRESTLRLKADEFQEGKKTRSKKSHEEFGYIRNHLQDLVDRLTRVYVHFRGFENVCRISSNNRIYGEYPDFIRAAAGPVLNAYLGGSTKKFKREPKLNAQIQDVVRRVNRQRLHLKKQ